MKKLLVLTTLLTIVSSIAICIYANTTQSQSVSPDVYTCDRCNGSRIDPQYTRDCGHCNGGVISILRDCLECYGTGKVKDQYGNERKCPKCDGAKKYFEERRCHQCNGTGEVKMQCTKCNGRGTVNR